MTAYLPVSRSAQRASPPPGESILEDEAIGLEFKLPLLDIYQKIVAGQYCAAVIKTEEDGCNGDDDNDDDDDDDNKDDTAAAAAATAADEDAAEAEVPPTLSCPIN
jgi:hypothetical protein